MNKDTLLIGGSESPTLEQGIRHMMGIQDSAYDWFKNHSSSGMHIIC